VPVCIRRHRSVEDKKEFVFCIATSCRRCPAALRKKAFNPPSLPAFVAGNANAVALQQNTVRFAPLPFAHLVYDFSMFLNS
jgi:hypothetical protein